MYGLSFSFSIVTTRIFTLGPVGLRDNGAEDLRTTTLEEFHETVLYCFNKTTEEMLGRPVRDEIFRLLGKSRLAARDLGERFDDVVTILKNAFGESARVIVYKTVVGLYDEYSQRHEFTYVDMLRERLELLKAKVTSDILKPRHLYRKSDDLYLPRPVHQQ